MLSGFKKRVRIFYAKCNKDKSIIIETVAPSLVKLIKEFAKFFAFLVVIYGSSIDIAIRFSESVVGNRERGNLAVGNFLCGFLFLITSGISLCFDIYRFWLIYNSTATRSEKFRVLLDVIYNFCWVLFAFVVVGFDALKFLVSIGSVGRWGIELVFKFSPMMSWFTFGASVFFILFKLGMVICDFIKIIHADHSNDKFYIKFFKALQAKDYIIMLDLIFGVGGVFLATVFLSSSFAKSLYSEPVRSVIGSALLLLVGWAYFTRFFIQNSRNEDGAEVGPINRPVVAGTAPPTANEYSLGNVVYDFVRSFLPTNWFASPRP
jgi:hypothetical protein